MRHLISAAMYTLTVVLLLASIGIYFVGEYTDGAFVKEFWWLYLLMNVSATASVMAGRPKPPRARLWDWRGKL